MYLKGTVGNTIDQKIWRTFIITPATMVETVEVAETLEEVIMAVVTAEVSQNNRIIFQVPIQYVEPPFEVFQNLEGAESVARVFNAKVSAAVGGKGLGQGNMMAIDNVDFAKAANFKRSYSLFIRIFILIY